MKGEKRALCNDGSIYNIENVDNSIKYDNCLKGTVDGSCQEVRNNGSLEEQLCIGNLVTNYEDDNIIYCNVPKNSTSNYYFT